MDRNSLHTVTSAGPWTGRKENPEAQSQRSWGRWLTWAAVVLDIEGDWGREKSNLRRGQHGPEAVSGSGSYKALS